MKIRKIFWGSFVILTVSLLLQAQAGSWKQVGKAGDWAGTIAGTALNNKIYTVEASGALYVTEPASGCLETNR